MSRAPLIISISGIRGIVGESLTDDVVHCFAAAFATTLQPGAGVVLARDTRPSGWQFSHVAAQALVAAGCAVIDLGVCSTPAAKLMVVERGAEGALILTASHNPAPWNGLKLIRADGIYLNAPQARTVERAFQTGQSRRAAGGTVEQVELSEVNSLHVDRVAAHVDVKAIRGSGIRVAVDPCNGVGGLALRPLLERLGVEAHFINAEADGQFAHEPEPVPANLRQLGDAVRASGAAVGFAVDPDADRVALVGADGEPLGEDYTLALAVAAVTARRRGPVVTTLSTSQVVSDAALSNDCPVVLTPVGEVHVVEKMLEEGAVIGGEGNGGVILTEVDPGRDAAVGVAVVLEALAGGGTLDERVNALPSYHIEKRKVECGAQQLARAVAALRARHASAFAHPVNDGVKLYLAGELSCPWLHLRASNTEPIVRIIAESETRAISSEICDEAERVLRQSA